MKVFLLSVLLIHGSLFVSAQFDRTFVPVKFYSEKSAVFLKRLSSHLDNEFSSLGPVKNAHTAEQICLKRSSAFKKAAKNKRFVESMEMEKMLYEILGRIERSNNLPIRDRMVLILNSPEVNAYCYARGIFVVTIGLLGKVHSRDELAFILCHEIGHDELRHVQENIVREADLRISKKAQDQVKKIYSENSSLADIVNFRDLMYSIGNHSRKKELEADSLGYVLHSTAGYNQDEMVNSLSTLDSAFNSRYSQEEFFRPFDLANIKFEKRWIKPTSRVYGSPPKDSSVLPDSLESEGMFWSIDSLSSHPDLELRRDLIRNFMDSSIQQIQKDTSGMKSIVLTAQFQGVEAAYKAKKYDKALFQILELMHRYPSNSYLVSRAVKIFIDVNEAKSELRVSQYASRYVSGYPDRFREVNSFLYQIQGSELRELAFQFLNNKKNFDVENPSHYYLLWRICQLTFRDKTTLKIAEAYRERFDKNISTYSYN